MHTTTYDTKVKAFLNAEEAFEAESIFDLSKLLSKCGIVPNDTLMEHEF